jgi:hypothetical protein
MKLEIFSSDLLQSYFLELPKGLGLAFNNLKDAEISALDFSFCTSVAAVFSSKRLRARKSNWTAISSISVMDLCFSLTTRTK